MAVKNPTIVKSPIWRPFTQMKNAPQPLPVERGEGPYIILEDGRRILDCISSWWVNIHGHAHPRLAAAVAEQAKKLEQVIFAGFTHAPAEQLAERLVSKLPEHLTRIFFSDNGSTAVEVALKMAYQYWMNLGQSERTRFIGFDGGYHGDTVGAMSLGASSGFWNRFSGLLFELDVVSYPSTFDGDNEVERKENHSLNEIDHLLSSNPNQFAAIFIEPLVQGAGGMHMCRPQFLKRLEELAKSHNVLIVYDEVMTGFGRTGDWFSCTKAGTHPDLICLSKGITGGFLPLAVTAVSENIYSAFLGDEPEITFFHGHSYTANPIACAVANESLTLLEETSESFMGMEKLHRALSAKHLIECARLEKFRFTGTIAAFDVSTQNETSYFNQIGPTLKAKFIDAGFLIRPLGNTIYLMPPYCVCADQLDQTYEVIRRCVDEL